jgi:hypothetical protein
VSSKVLGVISVLHNIRNSQKWKFTTVVPFVKITVADGVPVKNCTNTLLKTYEPLILASTIEYPIQDGWYCNFYLGDCGTLIHYYLANYLILGSDIIDTPVEIQRRLFSGYSVDHAGGFNVEVQWSHWALLGIGEY